MTHPKVRKMLLDEREGVGKPNRIAACMIMGDNYDHGMVCKTMASLKKAGIDKVFIAYNGRSRSTLAWLFRHMKKLGMPFLIQKFKWEEDFALARNQSFSLVPKDDFDWMMWIDADDEFVVEKPLTELFDSVDPYSASIWLRYDYAFDKETGEVKLKHWRERIMSTRIDWVWKWPVHETCEGPPGLLYSKRDHAYIKHLRDVEETGEETRARNRKIIAKFLRENPDNSRMLFYFATEVMAEATDLVDSNEKSRVAEAAIVAYRKYLASEQTTLDDSYAATTRIGDLYLMTTNVAEAVKAYFDAITIYPDWADAYIGLSQACMVREDWPRMKSFAEIALNMSPPSTSAGVLSMNLKYSPLLLKGIAEEELGELESALEDYSAAQKIFNPPTGLLDDKIRDIQPKIAVQIRDKDLRKNLRGKRSEKSIAFVSAPLPEPWHTETEKTGGAGGAETCIIRLAPMFAADGWRVAVFGTPGDNRGVDENGVEWWDSDEFLSDEPFKIVVGSRIPELFGSDVNAQLKLLWMHDVNVGPRLYPFAERVDKIIGLTNWHAKHLENLYGIDPRGIAVVPNGIDLNLYGDKTSSNDEELRFIWSSSPDRGLGTLVAMWPTIKSRYPTAKLDIFYGWNIIDRLIVRGDRRAGYLANMKKNILGNIAMVGGEDGGIFQHGRIPQKELSKWQLDAHVWGYPTDFMETFCITAIEMQAAGVIPVASKLAALPEVVASPELLVEGWPLNTTYQNQWLDVLDAVVSASDDQQIVWQEAGKELAHKYSWENSYTVWNDLIGGLNGRKSW